MGLWASSLLGCMLALETGAALPSLGGTPAVDVVRLENGVRVAYVEEVQHPAVHVTLMLDRGVSDEAPGEAGFSQLLFGRALVPEWSWTGPASEPGPVLAAQGAAESHGRKAGILPADDGMGIDRVSASHTVPRGALDLALWGLGATVNAFMEQHSQRAEAQRRAWIGSWPLRRMADEPGTRAAFLDTVLSGTAYVRFRTSALSDVESASGKVIAEYLRRALDPESLVIVLLGPLGEMPVSNWVEAALGGLPPRSRGDASPRSTTKAEAGALSRATSSLSISSTPSAPLPRRTPVYEHRELEQSSAGKGHAGDVRAASGQGLEGSALAAVSASSIGWRTVAAGHPDRATLDVLAHVLNGRARQRGASNVWMHRSLDSAGFMELRMDAGRAGAGERAQEFARLRQSAMRDLKLVGLAREELDAAIRELRSTHLVAKNDGAWRAWAVAAGLAAHGDPSWYFEKMTGYVDVTPAMLRRVAERYLPHASPASEVRSVVALELEMEMESL